MSPIVMSMFDLVCVIPCTYITQYEMFYLNWFFHMCMLLVDMVCAYPKGAKLVDVHSTQITLAPHQIALPIQFHNLIFFF